MTKANNLPKYQKGDMIMFKFVKRSPITYSGVIMSVRSSKNSGNLYLVASMNHGMINYTVSEEYVTEKIS